MTTSEWDHSKTPVTAEEKHRAGFHPGPSAECFICKPRKNARARVSLTVEECRAIRGALRSWNEQYEGAEDLLPYTLARLERNNKLIAKIDAAERTITAPDEKHP